MDDVLATNMVSVLSFLPWRTGGSAWGDSPAEWTGQGAEHLGHTPCYQRLLTHGAVQQRHTGRLLISLMSNPVPCPSAGTKPGTEDAPGSVCCSPAPSFPYNTFNNSTHINKCPLGSQMLRAQAWTKNILLSLRGGESQSPLQTRPLAP